MRSAQVATVAFCALFAASLLGQANVDGALVGGASLKAEQFLPIVTAAVGLAATRK